ncbi:MAG: hypothetical protein ACJ8AW_22510 [Rhodopila sp.]
MPLYDPYDPAVAPPGGDDEDGQVPDTAIAGRAAILATFNFDDFCTPNVDIIEPGRMMTFRAAHHTVLIAHANRVTEFLRTGTISQSAPTPTHPRRKQLSRSGSPWHR